MGEFQADKSSEMQAKNSPEFSNVEIFGEFKT